MGARVTCIALLLLGCGGRAAPEPPPRWNEMVDFDGLRLAYGERDDYSARCVDERPLRQLFVFAQTEEWDLILLTSESWLDSCPVDIDAHLLRAVALSKSGRGTESIDHMRWYRGLVDSVLATGDGRSPETAYQVISIPEQYSTLRALRLDPKGQTLLDGGINAISTVDRDGSTATIYFFPEAHWRRLGRSLGE